MPFTLAHPAAVVWLPRNRFIHMPALVIGSMSPDFVYFLNGRASGGIGHTLWGFVWVNLPLVLACYAVYALLWRRVLAEYLPACINVRLPPEPLFRRHHAAKRAAVFAACAFAGMASHTVWDAFTHETGWAVRQWAFLRGGLLSLPLYKWLQYGGGVGGLVFISLLRLRSARRFPAPPQATAGQKRLFWGMVGLAAFVLWLLWLWMRPVPLGAAATQLIRIIDCAAAAFTGAACAVAVRRRKSG